MLDVIDGLDRFCARRGIARVADLTGAIRLEADHAETAEMETVT